MPVRNASFLSNISGMEGKYPGEVEADGPNMAGADGPSMAGADGPSMAEADSANVAAVKTGLNNIAEVNETGGKSGGLVRMLMLLKGLNKRYWRYPHLWYVRGERAFIG